MKFTKYVVIGTFIFCFIVIISVLGTRYYKDNLIKDNPLESNSIIENVVQVDGKLYYSTGEESKKVRCGVMDGKITSHVESNKLPSSDNQSNFEGDYEYQYEDENSIVLYIDDKFMIYKIKD